MASITGLSHVSIKVADLALGVHFYCEGLGLRMRHRDGRSALIETGDDVLLELSDGGERVTKTSGFTHICLNTYDTDAAFERAVRYGAKPSRGDPYTYQDLRIAFLTAPTGEEVELWHIEKDGRKREPIIDGRYVKNFVHVALMVPDMDATSRFYEGLGLKMKINWGWGGSMQMADMHELELFTKGEYSDNRNGLDHIGVLTDDVEGLIKKAVAMGAEVCHEPYDWSNLHIAFLKGISGEILELFYVYPEKEHGVF